MAVLLASRILLRIRQVPETGAGTLRAIPSTRFYGDLPEGLAPTEDARRALDRPRIDARVTEISRNKASPPVGGNIDLLDIKIGVIVTRVVTTVEQLTDADRDTLWALVLEDADYIKQALELPGNLTTTTAGLATDLVSGRLGYAGSRATVRGAINDGAQTVETIHLFTGIAISRPATS